jgi:AAA domain-containing protein
VPAGRPILAPLLRRHSLNLLYGPRGLGKTFVALAIAHAAASGGRFLGWQAARPQRVLYVDGEMAAADVADRLALLGPAPETLEFILADLRPNGLPDIAEEAGQSAIWTACTPPPDLLVLDNLSSLAGHRTGDADPWPKLQRFLLRLRGRMAVLVVHHTNKRGALRGSAQHEDVLDLVLALHRPRDYAPRQGAHFELHVEKARALAGPALDPIEAQLRVDAAGRASWAWWPLEEQDIHRVTALLRSGLNPNQIARELGISKSKAYRLRDQMEGAVGCALSRAPI